MTPEEVISVIRELNEETEHVEDISESFLFNVQTDGDRVIVKYLGCTLWNSEDDCREFLENKESGNITVQVSDYEPLATYLRRERNKLLDNAIKHKR